MIDQETLGAAIGYVNQHGGGGGYVLPTATASRLGGVKIGSGISVEEDGTISASGGGVAKYADLPDKPSINGNELSGNKTGAQLGLQNALTFDDTPTQNSNNPVKSGGVYASDEAIRKWTTAEAKSVSGNPITLTDGSARNAEGLVVDCEPKQNLHGYDHPWAGGAGKNKLPMTVDGIKEENIIGTWSGNQYTLTGVTFTILTDEDNNVIGIKANGTASERTSLIMPIDPTVGLPSLTNQNLILSGYPSTLGYLQGRIWVGTGSYKDIAGQVTSLEVPFTPSINIERVWIQIYTNQSVENAVFLPMIRLASVSDATFEPYSNICPISGYDECVVDRDGKNLWNEEWLNGYYSSATGSYTSSNTQICSKNFIAVFPNTEYYFKIPNSTNGAIRCYDKDCNYLGYINKRNDVFTTPNDCYFIHINGGDSYGDTYNNNICINISDASFNGQYVPYSYANVTLTFGETIYGGSVDFKTGKVTVTKAYKVFDGTENWYVQVNANRVYTDNLVNSIAKPSASGTVADITSNIFGAISSTASYTGTRGVSVGTSGYVEFADGIGGMTVDAWKTYLENNTVAVCYELATPTELTLTPAELELLKGYNYISTNGTTIALDYLPDSLLAEAENYVDAKIPPAPTTDGTYVLTCTVTSGTPAYSWESAT